MKSQFDSLIWGLILIAAGGLFMARNLGYEVDLTPTFWMAVCGALSVLSFIRYFKGDRRRWGRIFPACLFAAATVIIGLSHADVSDSVIAAPLFVGFAIPFAVAVVVDHQKNYWAVVPATIFSLVALAALLDKRADGEFLGALVVLAISTPFFFVYFTQERQRWAIIPAGILASIGLAALISATSPAFDRSNVETAVFSLGAAATFAVLYLRRSPFNTQWAKYPAIIFGLLALLALFEHTSIDGGSLVLIGIGAIVLVSSLRSRRTSVS